MTKYILAMQPLVTAQQLEKTKQLIKQFTCGQNAHGTKLQLYLNEQREIKDNWAYEYWLNDMYLNNPLPLPVNSNPGMVFPPRKFITIYDIAKFAARMLDGILDHKEILDRRGLPQERATSREKGQPLCMSQYYRLLTSYRCPGKIRDSILSTENEDSDNEHIIVACRNQFYCVLVKAVDRGRLTEDEICSQFVHILNDAPCLANPTPVGLLTGDNRRKWGEVRDSLCQDDQNQRNLELIARSLLVVCMDEPLPTTFNKKSSSKSRTGSSSSMDGSQSGWSRRAGNGHQVNGRDETNMCHQMIHGGGSSYNSANRWFDKTIQLVISNDGVCGLCYEHSPSEGVAVVQLMENLLKRCEDLPLASNTTLTTTNETSFTTTVSSASHLPAPERLEWKLDARQHRSIQEAAITIDSLADDLDYLVYRFTGYGKNFIKSCQCSPDAYIQLALQLTYFRLYGHLVATYESASTRRFLLGRVDCIRSATQEALDWSKAMCQGDATNANGGAGNLSDLSDDELNMGKKNEEKLNLWNAAMKRQTEIMVDNIMGQGIDIHLLGLREAARETAPTAAHPLPELFTDDTYKIANYFLLSTSQVSTTTDSFMGYGPVVPDGYGASYNPHPDQIIFCLSAFKSSESTTTNKFAHALEESLLSMQQLLSTNQQK